MFCDYRHRGGAGGLLMDDNRSGKQASFARDVGRTASILTHSTAMIRGLGLPSQQTRIVELVMQGMQDKEIARELGLGLPTVRLYLRFVFEHTKTSNRIELILKIIRDACEHCGNGRRYQH
jgi:DNA-binding NarL/FixJ family response regulator